MKQNRLLTPGAFITNPMPRKKIPTNQSSNDQWGLEWQRCLLLGARETLPSGNLPRLKWIPQYKSGAESSVVFFEKWIVKGRAVADPALQSAAGWPGRIRTSNLRIRFRCSIQLSYRPTISVCCIYLSDINYAISVPLKSRA